MFNFQPWDIAVVLVVVLLLFGPKKLPEFAKGLGSAITEFKNAMSGNKSAEAKRIDTIVEKKDDDTPVG